MNPPPKIIDAEISASQLKVKLNSGITVLMPLDHVSPPSFWQPGWRIRDLTDLPLDLAV